MTNYQLVNPMLIIGTAAKLIYLHVLLMVYYLLL